MGTAKIPYLVPMRPDHGPRDRLWRFCRNFWAESVPELEVFEGLHLHGPFNRSLAINTAATAAGDWDVAIAGDSDVVADPAQVRAAIDSARRTGRMTLPYTHYFALKEPMTTRVLGGFNGNWRAERPDLEMTTHVSSLVVVPRTLWDRIGGFNAKLVSWGYDDTIFAQAARVLGGGIDRIPGTVFHLNHPRTQEAKKLNPRLKANRAIAQRYYATWLPWEMEKLVEEQKVENGVTLVVLTHGRRDCIVKTIPSAEANLTGLPFARRIISDDSGDIEYHAWLRITFPDYDLITGKPSGFAGNVVRGRNEAIASGHPWVFWLEDDFTFNRPVDLGAMATALTANPHITQMALRRQAWFPNEVAAGGVIEEHPEKYADKERWLEHRLFFTTNPHLTTREFLLLNDWPLVPGSERKFANLVLRGNNVSGYWGKRTDDPWVHHFGERTGKGY